jgi:uncharacterized membrane protein YphA (DoxX/SURF4 family)
MLHDTALLFARLLLALMFIVSGFETLAESGEFAGFLGGLEVNRRSNLTLRHRTFRNHLKLASIERGLRLCPIASSQ